MKLRGAAQPPRRVTLLMGDGIGPEVIGAARKILDATAAMIDWDVQDVGASAIEAYGTPLPDAAVESILTNRVALKGPVSTPRGGFRSANFELRERLGHFAQVRAARSLPGLACAVPDVDIAVVRETREDLYTGVEFASESPGAEAVLGAINAQGFRVASGSGLSVKAVSPAGCRRVAEFAFEWALSEGRRRVTVVHKATNIRCTDGLFLRIALEVAADYPDLLVDDVLVDAAAAALVRRPEQFDVLLTQSVFGDILSDLAAGLVGGIGVAPGANYGGETVVFEAVHGSAPRHAGRDEANPLGAVLSGVMLLRHLDLPAEASRVEDAVHAVVGAGTLTYDVADAGGRPPVSTSDFTEAVLAAMEPPAAAVPARAGSAGEQRRPLFARHPDRSAQVSTQP